MNPRESRSGWLLVVPVLVLSVWVAGATIVGRRGHVTLKGWLGGQYRRPQTRAGAASEGDGVLPAVPERLDDPRLRTLRGLADTWRQSLAERRRVIDQVCLVPDVETFLEAISYWDNHHYFPILIDEPAWTLPFLRSFRPARVVRYTGRRAKAPADTSHKGVAPPSSHEAEWSQALRAVAMACAESRLDDAHSVQSGTAGEERPAAPGLVLSAPESPMLAGAVALAAGHFQRLVRLNPLAPVSSRQKTAVQPERFHDTLTQARAWDLAHQIENCVAASVSAYDQLGDRCDFLTLAGDWPYRYEVRAGTAPVSGIYAVDDLIGRKLEGGPDVRGLDRSRRRWAYVGRLLGDPAASVARAMASLFLPPRSVLLWNTYSGGSPWNGYSMSSSARLLQQALPGGRAIVHRAGRHADLASWHLTVDPGNRYDLIWFNSSGGPDHFSINGGPGRPGDVPRGVPTAVAMIHSFSAADPLDPNTIAGRWLDQGAFIFFGSVWEPYLMAFRAPALVAELASAGVPLAAALRQGEFEPFGFPWRLVYLGDPLYRVEVGRSAHPGRAAVPAPPRPRRSPATAWTWRWTAPTDDQPSHALTSERPSRDDWRAGGPRILDWPVVEIGLEQTRSIAAPLAGDRDDDRRRLTWCLDAAVAELLAQSSRSPQTNAAGAAKANPSSSEPARWRAVLRVVRRERLDRHERRIFDELLIDALGEIGRWDELQARLERIPPEEAAPRVWETIETCALARLAQLAGSRDGIQGFAKALELWDHVMRLSWPEESKFPAQITERVSILVQDDRYRRLEPWRDRLRRTSEAIAVLPDRRAQAAAIAAERARSDR